MSHGDCAKHRPKGDPTRNGPKYQNSYAFHHNKNSKKTKEILAIPNYGVCQKCHEIIEWKKQYR